MLKLGRPDPEKLYRATLTQVQSNHVDTDTEGTIESVCVNGVSVLRESCYY